MSEPSTAMGKAEVALTLSRENKSAITAHEDLCAERYGNIHAGLARLEGILKWAGVTGFGIIIALLGFLALQMLNANADARRAADTKIDLLERQLQQPRPAAIPPVISDPTLHP